MEQLQLFFILAYCLRKGNESSLYRIPFFSYNKNSCSFERRISMAAKEELQDEVPRCEFIHAHPETIKAVQESMPADLCRLHQDPYSLCSPGTRNVCLRSGPASEHDPERHFPPASDLKAEPSCKIPQRGKNHLLFPARRTCPQHFKSGHGAHHRIEKPLITVSRIPRRLAPM